jgi:flagellar basal-body rod protein FlgG
MYQTIQLSGTINGGQVQQPTSIQIGLGANFASSASSFAQGPMQSTGNALDMAINGEGFFHVIRPDGTDAYTRDGSFKTDAQGLIVTNDGYALDPNITIPSGSTALNVAVDGTVSAILPGANEPAVLGQIRVSTFANPAGLTRVGMNLFTAGGASGDAQEATPGTEGAGALQSQYLEGSNVQVVDEMVRMILAQRAYEINSKAIQTADQMLSVINGLAR